MADKTETITLLPHPIVFETGEPDTTKDSRTEGTQQGKDVWKLVAQVPWTDYPVTYLTYPRTDSTKPTLGTYKVELSKGNPRKGKEGSGNDWDYFWNAITWTLLGGQEAPAPAPSGNGGSASGYSVGTATAEERKNRGFAIAWAKDAWCEGKSERGELFELAESFYNGIVEGFTEEE